LLKNEFIEINVSNRISNYYKNIGYSISGETILIKTTDLLNNSHIFVDVVCDECHKEYKLMYAKYFQNISHYGFFTCKKCSYEKKKLTYMERFGVENCSKNDKCKLKIKKTKLEKYDNENFNNNEKYKKTCMDRYGKDCYMKTDEFRTASKKSKLNKYGNEFFINIEKIKQTLLERYGVSNYVKTIYHKYKIWDYYNELPLH